MDAIDCSSAEPEPNMSLITVETVVDDNDEYVVVDEAKQEQQLTVFDEPDSAEEPAEEPVEEQNEEPVTENPKPQLREEPLEWDELVDIITVQHALEKLARSEQQQEEYEAFLSNLLEEWATVSDKVLCEKFPKVFTKELDEETQKYVAQPPIASVVSTGNSYVKVVRNDFPYNMAKGIEHWIVWKVGDESLTEEDITQAMSESILGSRLEDDMLHWVNPPHLKSLPELDHIHIVGKLKKVEPKTDESESEDANVPLLMAPDDADKPDEAGVPLLMAAEDDADKTDDASVPRLMAAEDEAGVPVFQPVEDEAGVPVTKPVEDEAGVPVFHDADQTEDEAGVPVSKPVEDEAGVPVSHDADKTEESSSSKLPFWRSLKKKK